MKKVFYSLSLALIGGLAANAAAPTFQKVAMDQPVSIEAAQQQMKSMKAVRIGDNGSKKSVKKGLPSSVDAYLGNWKWEGDNGLNGVVIPNQGVMSIERMEGTDSLLIRGFDQLADWGKGGLRGIFKNGRVYIPNQITCYDGNDVVSGGAPTIFCNYTLRNMTPQEREEWEAAHPGQSAEGYGYTTKAPEGVWFFLALIDNGDYSYIGSVYYEDESAEHTDAVLQQSWSAAAEKDLGLADTDSGWYWLCSHVYGEILAPFEFFSDEWKSVGKAKYQDAWMRYAYSDLPAEFDEYEVDVYRSNMNENRFLLLDPYGPNTPWGEYEINMSSDEGYLVFDITDPDCVIFEPFVYCMTDDMGDGTTPDLQQLYFYNIEGYYYLVEGTDIDQIISVMDQRGNDVSYFDKQTGKVWIYNGVFDIIPMGTFAALYNWTNGDMEGYVILPAGATEDGVESVLGEENAPAVYYNLQGVRVANPEKGQLLIVKKGNQTTKQVIR